VAALVALAGVVPITAHALTLDDRGKMRLGLRAYTAASIGTEEAGGRDDPLTFPDSGAGAVAREHSALYPLYPTAFLAGLRLGGTLRAPAHR